MRKVVELPAGDPVQSRAPVGLAHGDAQQEAVQPLDRELAVGTLARQACHPGRGSDVQSAAGPALFRVVRGSAHAVRVYWCAAHPHRQGERLVAGKTDGGAGTGKASVPRKRRKDIAHDLGGETSIGGAVSTLVSSDGGGRASHRALPASDQGASWTGRPCSTPPGPSTSGSGRDTRSTTSPPPTCAAPSSSPGGGRLTVLVSRAPSTSTGTPSTPGSRRTSRSSSTRAIPYTRVDALPVHADVRVEIDGVVLAESRVAGAGLRDRPADALLPQP